MKTQRRQKSLQWKKPTEMRTEAQATEHLVMEWREEALVVERA